MDDDYLPGWGNLGDEVLPGIYSRLNKLEEEVGDLESENRRLRGLLEDGADLTRAILTGLACNGDFSENCGIFHLEVPEKKISLFKRQKYSFLEKVAATDIGRELLLEIFSAFRGQVEENLERKAS